MPKSTGSHKASKEIPKKVSPKNSKKVSSNTTKKSIQPVDVAKQSSDNSTIPLSNPVISSKKELPHVSPKRRIVQICLLLAFVVAGYILYLQFSPQKKVLSPHEQDLFSAAIPRSNTDRLIIPKIAVSSPIIDGDYRVLEKGVWHRFPERGNPKDGGNFILAAHRYVFAWLPQRVNEQSVLYNIDKLNVGDTLYVDWQNKRYTYAVTEKRRVEPSESSIENSLKDPKKDAKLTLYSCTLSGERDGREVVIAHQQD